MSKRMRYDAKTKVKMVRVFLDNEYSYGEMVQIHGIPKTTMQRWVEIYKTEGKDGFKKVHVGNSNGKRQKATPNFEQKKNESLEAENLRLRAENDYLKKLHALVQKRLLREKKHKQSKN